eukprot:6792646-Prymnesium_polylepis.1
MAIVWDNSRSRVQRRNAFTGAAGDHSGRVRRKRSGRTGLRGVRAQPAGRTAAFTRVRARQPRPLPSTARRLAVTLA